MTADSFFDKDARVVLRSPKGGPVVLGSTFKYDAAAGLPFAGKDAARAPALAEACCGKLTSPPGFDISTK
jgi:hypothetical protein